MRGEQGFLYEERCNSILRDLGILPRPVKEYGRNSDTDGEFEYDKQIYKVEYKYDYKADMGQATLGYDSIKRKWYITGNQTPEGIAIQQMIRTAGAEDLINSSRGWGKKIPNKYTKDKVTLEEAREDYRNFPDRFIVIDKDTVNRYYAIKDKFYIQIGDLGFYYMQDNPAGLDVPQFQPLLRVRFRIKSGGSGLKGEDFYNYRFTVALQAVTRPVKSPYDITRDASFLLSRQK